MSTTTNPINSYDDALDFLPQAAHKPPRRGMLSTLGLVIQAMSDGLAAERRYHELTMRRGVAPDKAAALVLSEHYTATGSNSR